MTCGGACGLRSSAFRTERERRECGQAGTGDAGKPARGARGRRAPPAGGRSRWLWKGDKGQAVTPDKDFGAHGHVHAWVCMCVHVCMSVCVGICMCVHECACACVSVCTCVYVCMCALHCMCACVCSSAPWLGGSVSRHWGTSCPAPHLPSAGPRCLCCLHPGQDAHVSRGWANSASRGARAGPWAFPAFLLNLVPQ